jgi:hypothetical protein
MTDHQSKTSPNRIHDTANGKGILLSRLLDDCCSPNREFAWAIFLRRYHCVIRREVANRCAKWRVPRLRRQFSDVVDDIVAEVLFNLCKNDCQALSNFRKRDSESALLSWLNVVCKNACDNFIAKNFKPATLDEEPQRIDTTMTSTGSDISWELYESLVETLRSGRSKKRPLRERDIHIFLLYMWAGFSPKMIQFIFAKSIGSRTVDMVLNRMRNEFRTNSG